MDILLACLADHASADQATNKLNVAGIFDSIGATRFPAAHPRMYLALRLMAEHGDANRDHRFEFNLRDADHRVLQTMNGSLTSPRFLPDNS
jgi:hypothetical protein